MSRFLTLNDVAEVLNISMSQTYALVHSKALKAIKVGGRGQWRVEDSELESYIQRCYAETESYLDANRGALDVDQSAGPEVTST